jgi:hypothetical protein
MLRPFPSFVPAGHNKIRTSSEVSVVIMNYDHRFLSQLGMLALYGIIFCGSVHAESG